MTDPEKPQGPTMEEILASIRKMIPEEEMPHEANAPAQAAAEPAPEPRGQRALLLTRMVAEDGSIVRLEPAAAASAPPSPAAPPPPPPEDVLLLTNPMPPLEPAKPAAPPPLAAAPAETAPPANPSGGETMEAFLRRILEPQLQAWLNANLPPMVERMVQKVIDDVRREVDTKDETP
jgi:cell pole-organizing protein PopZ